MPRVDAVCLRLLCIVCMRMVSGFKTPERRPRLGRSRAGDYRGCINLRRMLPSSITDLELVDMIMDEMVDWE